jgi:hypothetical protein
MNKDILLKSLKALQNISVDFKIDYHFFQGKSFIRGIILNDPDQFDKVKSLLGRDVIKNFSVTKSNAWYLGTRRKVIYLKLKNNIELEIPELETLQVNNYA